MKRQVVGIGEILWDLFSSGPKFGGAPCNFACTAAELSDDQVSVAMVSGVGTDQLGELALQELRSHRVDMQYVQLRPEATGTVDVRIDPAGVASYHFAENTAWDNLEWSDYLGELAHMTDAVCFGTLGQRSGKSRETIRTFLAQVPAKSIRLLDVNIRRPYYSDSLLLESLLFANVLKVNEEEWPEVVGACGIRGTESAAMQELVNRFSLRLIAITRGADGAVLWTPEQVIEAAGVKVEVVDTVGAGDAFSAALIIGLLREMTLSEINRFAIDSAAFVCTKAGGTPNFPKPLQ